MTGYKKAPAVTTGEGPQQQMVSKTKPSRGGRGTEAPARPSTHTEGSFNADSTHRGPIVPDALAGNMVNIAVYFAVRKCLNHKTGLCCPSLTQIAKDAGCKRNTADKAVHRIAELGEWKMHMTRGHRTYYEFPDFDYRTKPWERTRKRRNDGDSEQLPASQNEYRQRVSELPASQMGYCQRLKWDTASVSNGILEPNKRTNGKNQSPKPPTGAGRTKRENHHTEEFNATLATLRHIAPKHDYPKPEALALADAYRRGLTSAQIISGVRTQAEAQGNPLFAQQLDVLIGKVGQQTHAGAGHVTGPNITGFGRFVGGLRTDDGKRWLSQSDVIGQAKQDGFIVNGKVLKNGERDVRRIASELDATKAFGKYLKTFGAKAGA